MVTADDFGLTAATSTAIVDAHRHGVVTATSILGNGPATAATLPLLAAVPGLEPGLHFALVGEDPPVSPATAIPTLVDRRGRFASSWRSLVPRLALGRVDPDDVQRELDAQLAVLDGAGIAPTHLNAHQHLQLWPSVGAVVAATAARRGIGFVRTPGSLAPGPRGAAIRRLGTGLRAVLAGRSLATTDGFVGLDDAGSLALPLLCSALAAATAAGPGSMELNVHPGAAVDLLRERYRWGYRWDDERRALLHPDLGATLERLGLEPVGPSALTSTGPGPSTADRVPRRQGPD